MKNMIFILSLFSVSVPFAGADEPIYRPYASCFATNGKISIEIMQNVNQKDVHQPFTFTIHRDVRGQKISHEKMNAVKVAVRHRDVLELFQSYKNKPFYGFELAITNEMMANGNRAIFFDTYGRNVVYCNHYVTAF